MSVKGEKSGWTVKKNGSPITNFEVEDRSPTNVIQIYIYSETLQSSDSVTVSYDGTSGGFAGKVNAFTDLSATWDSSL